MGFIEKWLKWSPRVVVFVAAFTKRVIEWMKRELSWLRDVVVIVVFMVVLRSSIVNWYVIPTGSMLPTIKLKDHVLVNKLSYGLMLPFSGTQIISWDEPKRGDIVLFESPMDRNTGDKSVTFVKRVIGVGGDTVAFEDGVLSINGELVNEEIQEDRSGLTDMGDQSPCNSGEGKNLFIEKFKSDSNGHYILRSSRGGYTNNETKVWVVPANQLLVVGDNRDCSNDGRFWGFVEVKKVYGKAVRVFYSIDTSAGGFPAFRGDRFFSQLK